MQEIRKKQLSEWAEFIAMSYRKGNDILLEEMAISDDVLVHCDDYESVFDGMLTYDDHQFHIHIDNAHNFHQGRGRFTLAHELAHYFIDEHRIGLQNGLFPPHGSRHDLDTKDPIELEADYFASNLLMPTQLFKYFKTPRKFTIDTISQLAQEFKTSFLSTVLRFAEIGNHSICVVVSENNIVKWFTKSNDFPDWPFKCRVGLPVPATTVAGEFFANRTKKYTGVEDIEPNDWFYPRWTVKYQLHEQCYYSDSYGYVVSFIWFD